MTLGDTNPEMNDWQPFGGQTALDGLYMDRAIREARRGIRGGIVQTYPNPAVGAVIVRRDTVLGAGWHRRAGMPHAEIEALNATRGNGHDPRGATIYVTLEPCNHHGRTPPCTEALIEAGIARVVVGTRDPNRNVTGKGIEHLRRAGVEVVEIADELIVGRCREINEAFHHFHETGRPLVTLKWAMTLDGQSSPANGREPKWFTGEAAKRDVHRLRAAHGCVAVGVGTMRADNPFLTVRDIRKDASARLEPTPYRGPRPLRLVVDARFETPLNAAIYSARPDEVRILGGDDSRLDARAAGLAATGATVWRAPVGKDGRISVDEILAVLAREGVQSLLVEGGRRLAASFFAADKVDRLEVYIAPALFGGSEGFTLGPINGWFPVAPKYALWLDQVEFAHLDPAYKISGWIQGKRLLWRQFQESERIVARLRGAFRLCIRMSKGQEPLLARGMLGCRRHHPSNSPR